MHFADHHPQGSGLPAEQGPHAALTVVANAVDIAVELAGTTREFILVGGNLRGKSSSLVGPFAEDNLQEIHADILFLGVDGFDPNAGITTPNVLESRVNRAIERLVEHGAREPAPARQFAPPY